MAHQIALDTREILHDKFRMETAPHAGRIPHTGSPLHLELEKMYEAGFREYEIGSVGSKSNVLCVYGPEHYMLYILHAYLDRFTHYCCIIDNGVMYMFSYYFAGKWSAYDPR